jgi:predicted dehydrogenase
MRALVIGLGSMGRKRTQILLEQGIQVFGVDPRADRRQYAEQHFQIESFDTFEKGLEMSPDLLIVCNKPNEHLPYVKYGLEHGIHSFSEENCVSDFAEIDEIIALSGNPNRPVAATSCSFRYHPCVQLIKRAIDEERVGPRGKGFITYHCGSYLPDWHSSESVAD